MPEFDQSLYWKLVPYFRVPMERVHVILVVSGPSPKFMTGILKTSNWVPHEDGLRNSLRPIPHRGLDWQESVLF